MSQVLDKYIPDWREKIHRDPEPPYWVNLYDGETGEKLQWDYTDSLEMALGMADGLSWGVSFMWPEGSADSRHVVKVTDGRGQVLTTYGPEEEDEDEDE